MIFSSKYATYYYFEIGFASLLLICFGCLFPIYKKIFNQYINKNNLDNMDYLTITNRFCSSYIAMFIQLFRFRCKTYETIASHTCYYRTAPSLRNMAFCSSNTSTTPHFSLLCPFLFASFSF